eukprot:516983-Rhodomonas_salina.3
MATLPSPGAAPMPEISEQNEALKRENAQLCAQIKALSQRLAQGSAGISPSFPSTANPSPIRCSPAATCNPLLLNRMDLKSWVILMSQLLPIAFSGLLTARAAAEVADDGLRVGVGYPLELVAGLRTLEAPMSVMTDSYKGTHFQMYPACKR